MSHDGHAASTATLLFVQQLIKSETKENQMNKKVRHYWLFVREFTGGRLSYGIVLPMLRKYQTVFNSVWPIDAIWCHRIECLSVPIGIIHMSLKSLIYNCSCISQRPISESPLRQRCFSRMTYNINWVQAFIRVHIHVHMYIYIYTYAYACKYFCAHAYAYENTYVYTYTYTCTCTHTYTYAYLYSNTYT